MVPMEMGGQKQRISEERVKSQFLLNGEYSDSLYLGITKEDFLKKFSRE